MKTRIVNCKVSMGVSCCELSWILHLYTHVDEVFMRYAVVVCSIGC